MMSSSGLRDPILALLAVVVSASAALTEGGQAMAPRAATSVIHAGQLLATPGEAPRSQQSIVIRSGRIEEIREGYSTPAGATVIDLKDRFVMPGFIDLHVHLTGETGSGGKLDEVTMTDADVVLTAAMYARRTLRGGFTTVRDLGSRGEAMFALREAIRANKVPGPKLLVAGEAITPTGGHGDVHGFRPEILEVLASTGVCDGADDCRAAVRRQVKRGADVIKVTATGGVLSETATGTGKQFTDRELRAIVETAHALGRKVTAHAHRKEGIEAALRAGFDSIEHAMWADASTMELFKETGAWLIPTVYPISYVGDTPEKMRQGPFKDLPAPIMEKLLKLGRQPKEMTALAYRMGVKIALGTDSGVSPHGQNANEFIEYVNIGMSRMEALMAGTVHAADAGGIEEVGTLEPGKAADIVAMPGNPLNEISSVLGVDFVMRDGIVFRNDR